MTNSIRNPSFATPGVEAGDAEDWERNQHADGVTRGRVENPVHDPTKAHVMVLGDDDLTASYENEEFIFKQYFIDFRDQTMLRFRWRIVTDSSFDTGVVWNADVVIDTTSIFHKTYEAGDEDLDESGTELIDISEYADGFHTVVLSLVAETMGALKFDNNTRFIESFEYWPGGVWEDWSMITETIVADTFLGSDWPATSWSPVLYNYSPTGVNVGRNSVPYGSADVGSFPGPAGPDGVALLVGGASISPTWAYDWMAQHLEATGHITPPQPPAKIWAPQTQYEVRLQFLPRDDRHDVDTTELSWNFTTGDN